MREHTVIQAQFANAIAASGAKIKTENDIINALNELETAEGLKIVDFVTAFCRECGIDPEKLGDYYFASTEYLAKKQKEDDRAKKASALQSLTQDLKIYSDNFEKGVLLSAPEMLKHGENISTAAAVLSVDHSLKKIFMSFDDYVTRRIDYNSWEEYAPDLFHKLPFPNGTINLIGARSGGGKTAALINLARDIITTAAPEKTETNAEKEKERNRRRRVVFISREMMIEAIYERLILSIVWDYARATDYKHVKKEDLEGLAHPTQTIWDTLRQNRRENPEYTPVQYLYNLVLERYIKPAINSEKLLLYNALDEDALETILKNVKTKTEAGDIILIDYVQLLPPSMTEEAKQYATADYLRARYIVTAIKKYAVENNVVFICAAQISSTAANAQSKGGSPTEADFKDSSDFGQAAHSAVIINREKSDNFENTEGANKPAPKLYYTCVKARSSYHRDDEFFIEWVPKYQYMGAGENHKKQGKQKTDKSGEKLTPEQQKEKDNEKIRNL